MHVTRSPISMPLTSGLRISQWHCANNQLFHREFLGFPWIESSRTTSSRSYGGSSSGASSAIYRAISAQGCDPDGAVNEASLEIDLQFYKEEGLVQGNVTVEQAVDRSFVQAALKELGPYAPKMPRR